MLYRSDNNILNIILLLKIESYQNSNIVYHSELLLSPTGSLAGALFSSKTLFLKSWKTFISTSLLLLEKKRLLAFMRLSGTSYLEFAIPTISGAKVEISFSEVGGCFRLDDPWSSIASSDASSALSTGPLLLKLY